MTHIPIYDASAPVVCTASSDEIPQRIAQIESLRTRLSGVERIDDGLVLHFGSGDAVAAEVRRFTRDEKACCQFWGFDVHESPGGTTLRWEGPPSVRGFFDELVRFLAGDEPATTFPGLF